MASSRTSISVFIILVVFLQSSPHATARPAISRFNYSTSKNDIRGNQRIVDILQRNEELVDEGVHWNGSSTDPESMNKTNASLIDIGLNGTDRLDDEIDQDYVVLHHDLFKKWTAAFGKVARGTGKFAKKAMKQLRVAGKKLKKFGRKAWGKMKTGAKKAFKAAKNVGREALYIAPDLLYAYNQQQEMYQNPDGAEDAEPEDTDPYDEYPPEEDDRPSGIMTGMGGTAMGVPVWVYAFVGVIVVVLVLGCLGFLYLGGKTDYKRRQRKHRVRKRKGESESSEEVKEETEAEAAAATIQVSTVSAMTEAPTVASVMTTKSAITEASQVAKPKKPKKKKKKGVLERIEGSLYAAPKKGKGKKKTAATAESGMVTKSTMTGATEPATEQATEKGTEKATEADMEEEPATSVKKSKKSKKGSKKKASAKKKGSKKGTSKKSISKKKSKR